MTFSNRFNQWTTYNDTQDASDGSIPSEAAVDNSDNNNNNNNTSNPNRDGRIHEKLNNKANKSLGQRLGEWCTVSNMKENLRIILGVGAAILILIIIIIIGVTFGVVKNKNSSPSTSTTPATQGDGEGSFDFSGVGGDLPSNETYTATATISGKPSTFPSIAPSEQNSTMPSAMPSTHEPSISTPPSDLPSDLPSLVPSTAPSTSEPSSLPSDAPSKVASSSPTYTPTIPVQPVAKPPILPFADESSESILTFCVIADVPYSEEELDELPDQIATQMDGCEFLVHLGDIFIGDTPCNIEDYETIQDIMLESHAPAFLVPGDNEWNDCVRSNIDIGWDHWTNHFVGFENNWNHTFSIMRQPGYEENFYFIQKRTLVFGLNIVGGRVHNETEWETRLQSEYDWVREVMMLNLQDMNTADGAILMAHAHPSEDHRDFFNAFRVFIRDELKNEFPVLYLHGDGHDFLYTPNYHNQSNFLRIQHEGGTNEPVLKIMAGPGRGPGGRSSAYDAFQYDRQLELLKNNNNKKKED